MPLPVVASLLAAPLPPLPLTELDVPSTFESVFNWAGIKALLPIPIVAIIIPALIWFFKDTWRELDREATQARLARQETGEVDYRPMACLVIVAMVLTLQEYYGGRGFYNHQLRPMLSDLEQAGWTFISIKRWDEFYGYCWWVGTRVTGYVLIPYPLWKLLFPKDSLLDFGLRTKGFFQHLWIYGLSLAVVLPALVFVAFQPDFGSYYPFYKNSARSWLDFLSWEVIYWLQFLTLEMFFRGFMVGALRKSMGASAIVVMALPYCMIHYGKPYLEAHGAIIAGIFLGSMAMRTKSIYSGFLLHVSVAVGMDVISLWKRGALPTVFWPQ